MPRKVFVAGEILTAADVNTNLADQAVMTFAGTAARGSAIGTAVEGMVTYLEDTDQLEVYDGSDWLSASNFLFGTATPTDGQVVSYSTAVSGYVPADAATGAGDNLLYNGAMQVAQRGTSETGITSGGYYTADRWSFGVNGIGTWTQTVEADAPTGSGFTKSLKADCTTADAAPAASDYLFIQQRLEGQDLQAVKKGTSSAESLTISFWVKSNVTGTYIVELFDQDNSRQISASYTISATATWEKKTVTFAGDTTGAFDNDNGASLDVSFWLGAGSDFTGGTLNTSWASNVNANRAVGQTNLAASTSNYWQVTGVQLETGTVASGFDHKPYGVELAECQRYYQLIAEGANQTIAVGHYFNSSQIRVLIALLIEMRTVPSLEIVSGTSYYGFVATAVDNLDDFELINATASRVAARNNTDVSGTAGDAGILQTSNAAAFVGLDAEL